MNAIDKSIYQALQQVYDRIANMGSTTPQREQLAEAIDLTLEDYEIETELVLD